MLRRNSHGQIKFSPSSVGRLSQTRLRRAETWADHLFHSLSINDQALAARFQPRFNLVGLLVALGFAVLFARLGQLQLATGDQYLLAAYGNRIRDEVSYAPRGTIYDRNGKILARNRADFQLTVTPYLLNRDNAQRAETYARLGSLLGQSAAQLQAKAEIKGLDHTLPVLIGEHIDREQAILIEQELPELSGFSIDVVPIRDYVAEGGLAHILGYVGRVNETDLEQRDDILPTDFVGRNGIEAQYDGILRGRNGRARTEVDALGRPVRLLAQVAHEAGTDITLTIDYDLQLELERQLRAQMESTGVTKASAVMMDTNSGEVLAMVSIPYFDNNLFASGISAADYQGLVNNPDQPLFNKAIGGGYPTGSTIKPLVASAALQEGVVTPETIIVDRGSISVGNFVFRGWRPEGLGPMNLRRAIAMSSNIYFYTVGGGHDSLKGLGVDRLAAYYRQFGLGEATGVDLPGETSGRVPDPAWKEETRKERWYLGDTYNISIGQGDLKASPLQMVVAHAAIANGGKVLRPQLLKAVHGDQFAQPQTTIRRMLSVDNANLQVVREGMHEMVYQGAYCACRFDSIPVQIAGKTGTAETDKINPDSHPHAWFIANGPWDASRVILGVMVEEGQKSANALNPVINTLSYYFHNR